MLLFCDSGRSNQWYFPAWLWRIWPPSPPLSLCCLCQGPARNFFFFFISFLFFSPFFYFKKEISFKKKIKIFFCEKKTLLEEMVFFLLKRIFSPNFFFYKNDFCRTLACVRFESKKTPSADNLRLNLKGLPRRKLRRKPETQCDIPPRSGQFLRLRKPKKESGLSLFGEKIKVCI